MKPYTKRIEEYKELIQEEYVRDTAVQKVVRCCSDIMTAGEDIRLSYFEFLYSQMRFVKKRWWGLQGAVLLLLWLILRNSGDAEDMGRILGILSIVFVDLIIPEIWKNQRYAVMEVEGTAFYTLRQICAARILMFAAVDLLMVTAFFAVSFYTVQMSAYRMIMDFLIPFNVSGCICFGLLYSRKGEMEYVTLLLSGIWMVIWAAIVVRDEIYQSIAEPAWIGILLLSFGFLAYCIRRSQKTCENGWEEYVDGIRA